MDRSTQLLAAATTAIRDLQAGYPANEIVAPSGMGVDTLLRDLVAYLRGIGFDDEGSWDCDATDGIEVRKTPEFEPFTLVAEARATSQFGLGPGPAYAEIRVTPEFVERLLRLSKLCKEHGLRSVTTDDAVDRWDQEDDLRIRGCSLRVYGGDFWFEAYPKYASYNVETVSIGIADLASVAALSTEGAGFRRVGDKVFYADDEDALDCLIDLYEGEDEGEAETCDECGCHTDEVIGCPDGAEICRQCFDQGAH
jgi:hypothetical protein